MLIRKPGALRARILLSPPLGSLLSVFLLGLLCGCEGLLFHPSRALFVSPERLDVAYEDIYFNSSEGVRLHAWFLPAQGAPKTTVLFLHGNAQNISAHIGAVYLLPRAGFNVFLFDYRGYGKSQGVPSLKGALEDAEAALRLVTQDRHYSAGQVVVYGQSLGGGLAIYASAHSAYRAHIQALIVESAPSDYRRITREKLAGLWVTRLFQWPLSLLMTDAYSPERAIPSLSPIPLLILHGDADPVVPVYHATRLYAAAHQPKELWIMQGGNHIEAMQSEQWRPRLVDYLNKITGKQALILRRPADTAFRND